MGSLVLWDIEIEVADPQQEEQIARMLGDAYNQVLQLLREQIAEAKP